MTADELRAQFHLTDKRLQRLTFWQWWALITGIDTVILLAIYGLTR